MNTNSFISVVLPVYNGEKYLGEAIDSILGQTYGNFELIVVNDGSTDGCSDIIRSKAASDNRIQIIERENRGLVASLNEAIDVAKGDFIARMDADDVSLPERFEKQVDYLLNNNADIVGGHYLDMNSAGKIINCTIVPVNDVAFVACLALHPPYAHGSVMFRRSFWVDNGMRYGKRFSEAEDYALWQEFYGLGARMGNIDEIIFRYRQHEESFSAGKLKRMNQEVKVLRKIFIKQYSRELSGLLKDVRSSAGRSASEELILLEMAWLLFRYTGNGSFFRLIRVVSKKNLALVMVKILSRTL